MDRANVVNFGAGPSALPLDVLEEVTKGLINYNGTGIGITELSHRSKDFSALIKGLEDDIRDLLVVPDTHSIVFMQGGGSTQFSAVVLNLLARHKLLFPTLPDEERVMDFVVTGSWSKKAADEARRLGGKAKVNIVVDSRHFSADGKSFDNIPPHDKWNLSTSPVFVYYCENETVDGVQFSHIPGAPTAFPHHLLSQGGRDKFTPLVADYSSSFLSRPIPHIADHALIYAGAQKNIGPAGLTIAIVRKDLLVDTDAATKLGAVPVPLMLSYKVLADSGSLHNTPPMFSIYVARLVVARVKDLGGATYMEQFNESKRRMLSHAVEQGVEQGVFKFKVQDGSRSWMNCTFTVEGDGLEQKFIEGATKRGLLQLKGHRSVGGIRVSLYNAITEEDVALLVAYIHEFLNELDPDVPPATEADLPAPTEVTAALPQTPA
ncbi:phosphoserine aminotransferase [Exidia glandulosa HHB12029]|uniref:phosphoserine transaminase n=1 Tax=Exidia glandulosa HHB12029 TaxID=1314781 RepID=A0A165F3G4_EXIGL|nr:phosphoserine aminotransferase [Exidia glandulosa HHB12029]